MYLITVLFTFTLVVNLNGMDITEEKKPDKQEAEKVGKMNETPLMEAITGQQLERVKNLINTGADITAKDYFGRPALHRAIDNPDTPVSREIIEYIINNGNSNIEELDSNGQTPLIRALVSRSFHTADMLLEGGANPNAKYDGASALHYILKDTMVTDSIEIDGGKIFYLLLDIFKADPNTVNNENNTPLHLSAQKGFSEYVRHLLEHGALVDRVNNEGKTAIQLTMSSSQPSVGYASTADQLFKKGAKLDLSYLPNALHKNNVELASVLFKYDDQNDVSDMLKIVMDTHDKPMKRLAQRVLQLNSLYAGITSGTLKSVTNLIESIADSDIRSEMSANIAIDDYKSLERRYNFKKCNPLLAYYHERYRRLVELGEDYHSRNITYQIDQIRRHSKHSIEKSLFRGTNLHTLGHYKQLNLVEYAISLGHIEIAKYLLALPFQYSADDDNDADTDTYCIRGFKTVEVVLGSNYAPAALLMFEAYAPDIIRSGLTEMSDSELVDHLLTLYRKNNIEAANVIINQTDNILNRNYHNQEICHPHVGLRELLMPVIYFRKIATSDLDAFKRMSRNRIEQAISYIDYEGNTLLHVLSHAETSQIVECNSEPSGSSISLAPDLVASDNELDDIGSSDVESAGIESAHTESDDVEPDGSEILREIFEGRYNYNVEINHNNNDGATPLHVATALSTEVLLNQATIVIDAKDKNGATALHYAAKAHNLKKINLLLQNSINVDTDFYGNTPLHYVVSHDGGVIVRNLEDIISIVRKLSDIVSIKGANKAGHTILHFACYCADTEMVKLLFENDLYPRSDINKEDEMGRSALHIASFPAHDKPLKRQVDIVNTLLQNGANIDMEDRNRRTPLHDAVMWCEEKMAETLLTDSSPEGVINKVDMHGKTALHYAVMNAKVPVVKFLMTRGALMTICDLRKRNVYHELASQCKGDDDALTFEMLEHLLSNEARESDEPPRKMARTRSNDDNPSPSEIAAQKGCTKLESKLSSHASIVNCF